MSPYFDFDGKEIDLLTWGAMFEDPARVVEVTDVGPYRVSTVWLGTDLEDPHDGPPLIYGSALFAGRGMVRELFAPDRQGALGNHARLVELAQVPQGGGLE